MAKKEKSKFLEEFKKFIARGNVIDMAVGVVVGSAFTAIVNQLVQGIINPCIGKLFGDINLADYKVVLTAATEETPEVAILYGSFIQAIINFLLVALSVFVMVRAINKVKDAMTKKQREEEEAAKAAAEAAKEPEAPPEPSEEILLLREIRDSLKK
ncbi:MAG: large conductance mechanosensitive channel protein MscL [Clostridia bacterium]|nr:large conductance mechanosensitive channel protein MscL [Clostridia bacterium]MBQ7313347.1 large conductance mechanosensitive channel protein MscL [Clostridia bacterium]